jgi:predicted dehydrogenase
LNTHANPRLKVAVVGVTGHAARLISLVRADPRAELACVYHPKPRSADGLPLTSDFKKVLAADAVVVASPTPTHAAYLRKLSRFAGHVFVEKPAAATAREVAELRRWPKARKSRLLVNYNMLRSPVYAHLKEVVASPELGRPIYLDVHVSYGPAFSPAFRDSWKTDRRRSLGAIESIGVHFINLALALFGPAAESGAAVVSAARRSPHSVDTGLARLTTKSGVLVNIFHSHAGPFYWRVLLMGTNGYWEYDGKEARLHSPRETFHADGSFAAPPLVWRKPLSFNDAARAGLEASVRGFLDTARAGGRFDARELDLALSSADPLLGLRR